MDNTGTIRRFTPEEAAVFDGSLVPLNEVQAEILAKLDQADRAKLYPLMESCAQGYRKLSYKQLKNGGR